MCLKECTSFMHSRPTCVGVNYISVKKLYKMLTYERHMHSRPTCVGVNYILVKKLYKMLTYERHMHSRSTCVGVNYISVKKLYKMLTYERQISSSSSINSRDPPKKHTLKRQYTIFTSFQTSFLSFLR